MARKPDPGLIDDDAPEMTDEELSSLRPAKDVLPPALFAALTKRGRPARTRMPIALETDVVAAFKAANARTWHDDIDAVLRREAQKLDRRKGKRETKGATEHATRRRA